MSKDRRRYSFPWKSFIPQLASIAIPVALQNLLTTTGSMIDTMMIARLGENSVGAIGLCGQYANLMFAGYWGFLGGGMLFFAQYWGAKDEDGIDRSYGITLTCLMAVGVIFASMAAFFPQLIMRLYTDKEVLWPIGIAYLRIIGIAYILQVLSMAASSLLRATEQVRIPLYASIASVGTNIFLNWVLIYGNLGAPALGVRGAALATVAASFVNLALVLILARRIGYPYLFHFRKHFKWTWGHVKEFFIKCFPILCNEVLIGVGNMVIAIVMGRQSAEAIAALAVVRTFEGMIIGFFAGFSNAASVLVGASVGAGDLRTAYERAKRLVYLCCSVIGCASLLMIAFHRPLLTVMNLDGESYRIGTGMLIIYCLMAIIRMGNWIQNDTYRSAGDARKGTVLEIVFMYLMVLPVVILAGLVLRLPVLIIFACCYVDEPIRFVLMQIHMYSGKWIRPVTPQGKAAVPAFMEELRSPKG